VHWLLVECTFFVALFQSPTHDARHNTFPLIREAPNQLHFSFKDFETALHRFWI